MSSYVVIFFKEYDMGGPYSSKFGRTKTQILVPTDLDLGGWFVYPLPNPICSQYIHNGLHSPVFKISEPERSFRK
jgi:hypothetical protein